MHHLLIPAIELVLGGAALAWSKSKRRAPEVTVEWTGTRSLDLPLRDVRGAATQYLASRGCVALERDDLVDCYRRGDRSVTRVPCERDLRWSDIPVVLVTGFAETNGRTMFHYRLSVLPTVSYSPAGRDFFLRQAQAEFDAIVELLESLSAQRARAGRTAGNGRRPNHRWYPDEEETQDAPSPDGSLDADLALLGLKRGATFEQVTKAYRVACHKYHPDRLAGKDVEPHLVELAVQRFKEVAAAYQRLRDRMGRHA